MPLVTVSKETVEIVVGVYIYQPFRTGKIWHKVDFYAEFNRFDFRDFILQEWLPNQG